MRRIIALLVLLSPAVSLAQDASTDQADPKVVIPPVQNIEFDVIKVNGTWVGPSGVLTVNRQPGHFNPLFRLRENFDDVMKAQADQVR